MKTFLITFVIATIIGTIISAAGLWYVITVLLTALFIKGLLTPAKKNPNHAPKQLPSPKDWR